MEINIDNYYIITSSMELTTTMSIYIDDYLIIHKQLYGRATREGLIKAAVDSISIYNSLHGCQWGEYKR